MKIENFSKKSSLRKMHLKFKSYAVQYLLLLISEISPNWNKLVHRCLSVVID